MVVSSMLAPPAAIAPCMLGSLGPRGAGPFRAGGGEFDRGGGDSGRWGGDLASQQLAQARRTGT